MRAPRLITLRRASAADGVGAADCYGTQPEQVYDLLTSCGLKLSVMKDWLEGARPLDRAAFANQFYAGLNFYFLAHP